jgi:hypothetical protein
LSTINGPYPPYIDVYPHIVGDVEKIVKIVIYPIGIK